MRSLASATLAFSLSTVLLVPTVHWCALPWEQTTVECVARCSTVRADCETESCPLSTFPSDAGKHGRAYVLGEAPGGTLVRGLGKLVIDLAQFGGLVPPRVRVEVASRPTRRPPDPEVRPPT